MSNVLVVIDVQNFFAVEKAADLPYKIAKHIQESKYDYVIFTKYINDPSTNFRKILGHKKATTPPDTDIHSALIKFTNSKNTFPKTTYSAFKNSNFQNFLQKNSVKDIDLCGINIDGCVLATAYEAFDLGYNVKILEELSSVASFRQDYEDSAKTIIARNLRHRTEKEKQLGNILDFIRQNPGTRPSEINKKFKLEHSANLRNILIDKKLARKERQGQVVRYYPIY